MHLISFFEEEKYSIVFKICSLDWLNLYYQHNLTKIEFIFKPKLYALL